MSGLYLNEGWSNVETRFSKALQISFFCLFLLVVAIYLFTLSSVFVYLIVFSWP